ncbi:MAG: hypothetical protein V3575_00910 [Candidatus Absconditabacteria bacterium]
MSENLKLIPLSKRYSNENPSLHCRKLLDLLPTIADLLKKCIIEFNEKDFPIIKKTELSDNSGIPTKNVIKKGQESLIKVLKEINLLLNIFPEDGFKYPIQLIVDKCYTNHCIHLMLMKIFGPLSKYFVETIYIDRNKNIDENYIKQKLHPNSIIIIGGSYEDPYALPIDFYKSYLVNYLKKILSEFGNGETNNRLLGICFGQQLMSILFGHTIIEDERVITTIKGPAQFSPSICKLLPNSNRSGIFRKAIYGLKGNSNKFITMPFTRTGFVDFDVLRRGGKDPIIPLVQDIMTDGIVGWGTPNGKALGFQFHPELTLTSESIVKMIVDELRSCEGALSDAYFNENFTIETLIDNYNLVVDGENIIKRGDIGESFYTFALLAFARDILNSLKKQRKNKINTNLQGQEITYESIMKSILNQVHREINRQMIYNRHNRVTKVTKENRLPIDTIENLDKAGLLKLPPRPDWKVSRGNKEVSETLGLKNIVNLIGNHKSRIESNNLCKGFYTFRDRGAGDGTLLKALYQELKNENIIFYGVGDYIYGDLFSFLKKEFPDPKLDEIIKVIVQKTMGLINYKSHETLFEDFNKALNTIKIDENDIIKETSYTSEGKTLMFDKKENRELTKQSKELLKNHGDKIMNSIRAFFGDKNNFYKMFQGYFERIIPANFAGFSIEDEKISLVDFQIAIRSTSHVNSNELKAIIDSYVNESAKPGSIYLENGVHRSYTYSPRIKELYDIEKKYNGVIKIYLILDYNSNYFTGAIILNAPFYDLDNLKKEFKDGFNIIDINDAYKSFFFRFERFLRTFIITNFKNFDIFRDFNYQIMDIIYFSYNLFKTDSDKLKVEKEIKKKIILLINFLVTKFNEKNNTIYNGITLQDFENYTSPEGDRISDLVRFLDKSDENWINPNGNRNY